MQTDIVTLAARIESKKNWIRVLRHDVENPERVQREIARMQEQVADLQERIVFKQNQVSRSRELLIDAMSDLSRMQKRYAKLKVTTKDIAELQRLAKKLQQNRKAMAILEVLQMEDE